MAVIWDIIIRNTWWDEIDGTVLLNGECPFCGAGMNGLNVKDHFAKCGECKGILRLKV